MIFSHKLKLQNLVAGVSEQILELEGSVERAAMQSASIRKGTWRCEVEGMARQFETY